MQLNGYAGNQLHMWNLQTTWNYTTDDRKLPSLCIFWPGVRFAVWKNDETTNSVLLTGVIFLRPFSSSCNADPTVCRNKEMFHLFKGLTSFSLVKQCGPTDTGFNGLTAKRDETTFAQERKTKGGGGVKQCRWWHKSQPSFPSIVSATFLLLPTKWMWVMGKHSLH